MTLLLESSVAVDVAGISVVVDDVVLESSVAVDLAGISLVVDRFSINYGTFYFCYKNRQYKCSVGG